MNIARISKAAVLCALLTALIPTGAGAQLIGILSVERLSILEDPWTGARASSMGGAFTAVGDDVSGLVYNPAGMTAIGGNTASFGLQHSWLDVRETYDGEPSDVSSSYTSFEHIGGIFPYSTYSTDIMFGFGVFRTGSSDLEYIKRGPRADLDGYVENVFLQTGGIYQYRFAASARLSGGVSAGGALVFWDQGIDFTERIGFEGPADSSYTFVDDVSADLDGVSFEFGVMARLSEFLFAGAVISSPAWLNYTGNGVETYTGSFEDGVEWEIDPYYFYTDDDYTIPMSFRAGLAFQSRDLTLSTETSWTDYSQTRYNGDRIYFEDMPGKDLLKTVWTFRAGAEYRPYRTPLSLRAGYALLPMPYRGTDEMSYVEESADQFWLVTDWEFHEVSERRQFFTAGAGYVFDRVLAVDLAFVWGRFERETLYLVEERETKSFMASASYRF